MAPGFLMPAGALLEPRIRQRMLIASHYNLTDGLSGRSHHSERVVTGKTDGVPMEIQRTKPSPGLTLSVMAEGPVVLLYKVARNGKPEGEGRMTLVEDDKASVDISWPAGQPQYAG